MIIITWLVYRLVKAVLWPYIRVRYRFEVAGRCNLPKGGGYILAANHQGWLDTIIIPIFLRAQVAFAAKKELFGIPGFKQLLVLTGQIPLKRKGATFGESREFRRRAEAAMDRGHVLGIFPEGTRSRTGRLLPFEPGTGLIATQTRRPVVPVGLSYRRDGRRLLVRIAIGPPMDSTAYRPKELTAELRRRIAELSGRELTEEDVIPGVR